MDVPRALLWVAFMTGLATCCVVYDKEYDPEKHSILCSTNLTVSERLIKELLESNSSATVNSHLYSQLVKGQLDDLMAVFRESVAEAYLKQTCHNHFCHPHVLGTAGETVPADIPRLLDVTRIQHITSMQLRQEIIDLVSINSMHGTFISAAYVTGTEIGLFNFTSGVLAEMTDFTSYPGTCLATTGNVWGPPLVISSQCRHPAVKMQDKLPATMSYVFKPSEVGLEMMQILKSDTRDVTALDVYWRIGLPHVLLVASPTSFQYKWKDYGFVLEDVARLPAAKDVASFRIGGESYLVFAGRPQESKEPVAAPNVFVFFSDEHEPTHYRMFQRLPECHAADVEHFTMSSLHFLLVACENEDFSHIFWWTGTQFVLWQSIPVRRATSWTVARLPNLETVLVAVEYSENTPVIRLFQFEGGYFWPTDRTIGLNRHRPDMKIKVVSFLHDGSTYLVVAGRPKQEPQPDYNGHIPQVVHAGPPRLSPDETVVNPGFPLPPSGFREYLPVYPDPEGFYQPVYGPEQVIPYPPRSPHRLQPPLDDKVLGYDRIYGEDLNSYREFGDELKDQSADAAQRMKDSARDQDTYPIDVLSVFRLIVEPRRAETHSESTLDAIRTCLMQLDASVNFEQQKMEQLLLPTSDSMMIQKPQTITGPKDLPEGLLAEEVVVENLILGPNVHVQPIHGFTCEECDEKVNGIKEELNRILTETGDLVQLSLPQVITAPKKFKNVEVNGMFNVKTLTTAKVCGRDLALIQSNMLLKTGDQSFNSSIQLDGDVVVDNLGLHGPVNGIDLKDVATLTGSHTFTAPQTFRKITTSNVQVSGTLNGVDPAMAVVSDVPRNVKGVKTIRGNLIVEGNINVGGKINQVDLADLVNRFVTIHTPQTIPANVTFANFLTFHQDVKANLFRGIDLLEFSKSVVNTNEEQILEDKVTFNADVRVFGNVREVGLINSINLNLDVLTTQTDQFVENDVVVLGDLFVRGDLDVETINGLSLSTEVVTTLGEQSISGRKVFMQPVKLLDDLKMPPGKTVNKVDISQLGKPTGKGQTMTVNNLNVDFINGQNVHNILGNALRKSVRQHIVANYSFLDVTFGDLFVNGLVGGRKPELDFITTQTEQAIERDVHFGDNVVIRGNAELKDKKINGQDISKLEAVIVKTTGDQIIGGRKTFAEAIMSPSIDVLPGMRINELDLSEELFLLDKDQEVKDFFTVDEVILSELLMEGNLNPDLLNGVNITDFLQKVVYADSSRVIGGRKEFFQDVKVRQRLDVNLLNGVNLQDFERKIVRLSATQTLTGGLTFKGNVFFNGPVHVNKVNGIKLSSEAAKLVLAENGVSQHGVKFSNCFNVLQDINKLRYLNGREVNIENILSKTRPQVLVMATRFAGDTFVDNLHTGQLDGVVIEDIALVDQPTTILSPLVFIEHLEAGADVNVQGQLNGVFVDKLKNQAILPHRGTVIHGPKTFRNIIAEKVNVAGLLNGVKIHELPNRIVSRTKEQIISGNVVFEENISVFDLHTQAPVNDIHLNEFRRRALTKTDEQTVTGVKHFSSANGITAGKDFEVSGDITRVGLVDGVDITKEASIVVMQGRNQTINGEIILLGETIFSAPLFVKGTINNIHIPKDVVMVEGEQHVMGMTTFQELTAKYVVVKGNANGVNLGHLIAKRATLHSNETIRRPLVFADPATVMGNLEVKGKMNNLDCRTDLVTVHTPQEIVGSKHFEIFITSNLKTDFVNSLHWLVIFNLIHSAVERKWIHMEEIIFEQDIKLEGKWLNDDIIRENTKALVPRIQAIKQQAGLENDKFSRWSQASDACLKSFVQEIPKLVTYVDYLDIIYYLESSEDLAVINFNTELHLMTVSKPNTDIGATCENVFVHRCFHSEAGDLCELETWPTPLPVYSTQSVQAVTGPSSAIIVFRNSPTAACPERQGQSVTGTQAVVLQADSLSVLELTPVMADAVAILPGMQSSLIALATKNNLDIKQIICTDVCEVMDTNINARLYDGKAVAMKWFHISSANYLLVINSQNVTTKMGEAISYIFKLHEEQVALVLTHTIHTTAATDGVTFEDHGRHYVAISSYDCTQDIASDRIDVFEVTDNYIRSVQKLPLSAVSLATATFMGETYLFASHALDDVLVYRWEDFFKFRLWTRIPVMAPHAIQPFIQSNQLFIAVSSKGTPFSQKTSPIVLAVTKGISEIVTNTTGYRLIGLD